MTEEHAFELTPVDIRAQEFRRVMRGYSPDDVEDFKQRMAEEIENHLKAKARLEDRMVAFREQLKAFREREKAMNDALLAAQNLKVQTHEAAEREAALTIKEARLEADGIVSHARDAESAVQRDLETVQHQFRTYVASFRRLLERQMAEVDAICEHELDGTPPDTTDFESEDGVSEDGQEDETDNGTEEETEDE